jgi:hypothetical protein
MHGLADFKCMENIYVDLNQTSLYESILKQFDTVICKFFGPASGVLEQSENCRFMKTNHSFSLNPDSRNKISNAHCEAYKQERLFASYAPV